MTTRTATISRQTKETQIELKLDLDSIETSKIKTGIGYFDHNLDLLTFHGEFQLDLDVNGDLYVDDHHTVEDVGISLGQAFREAIGDRKGVNRYGSCRLPMDETLVSVDLDLSNRGYLVFNGEFTRDMIGDFSTEMVHEFLYSFAINAGITLHVNIEYGRNNHHMVEAIFKGLGRALNMAKNQNSDRLPSTKGVL